MGTDVDVVIVSHNTRELLRACLASVLASKDVAPRVFVVDNASSDGSPAMVAAEFPQVLLHALPDNRGFAAANNVALRESRADAVLLLNPDATVTPGTIARLRAALEAEPAAAAVGPRILNTDGSLQSCGFEFPTLWTELRMSRRVDALVSRLAGPQAPREVPATRAEADWCDGACLMIRRLALGQVGVLDEQYFLYSEELDWCFSARRAGWTIAVEPRATAVHHLGQSSTGAKPWVASLLVETRLRFYRKHHGIPTALAAAAVLGAGFLKQFPDDAVGNRAKLDGIRRWWRTRARRMSPPVVSRPTPRQAA